MYYISYLFLVNFYSFSNDLKEISCVKQRSRTNYYTKQSEYKTPGESTERPRDERV